MLLWAEVKVKPFLERSFTKLDYRTLLFCSSRGLMKMTKHARSRATSEDRYRIAIGVVDEENGIVMNKIINEILVPITKMSIRESTNSEQF